MKKPERRRDGYQTNFYMKFHIKDDLEWNSLPEIKEGRVESSISMAPCTIEL